MTDPNETPAAATLLGFPHGRVEYFPAKDGMAPMFEVGFVITMALGTTRTAQPSTLYATVPVETATGDRSYEEVETAAARRLPEALRQIAERLEAELARVDAARAARRTAPPE